MARITVEDCIDKVPNRFDLVLLAAHRAREISMGSELTIDRDKDKNPVVALREIADETLTADQIREAAIESKQVQIEIDEPEEDQMAALMGSEGVDETPEEEISEEKIFELAIESGADECISHNEFHEIQCSINEIYNVKKQLEKVISNFISTEIEWVALNNADVEKDRYDAVIEFLETLEEDDDVQNVFSNANFGNN